MAALCWFEPALAAEFQVTNIEPIVVSTIGSQVHYEKPRWSPDGSSLSFETRSGKERRLHVHVFDTGIAHELTSERREGRSTRSVPGVSAVANYDAAWSSDGQKVTYVGSGAQGHFGLYYIDFGDWSGMTSFVAGGDGDPYVAFPNYFPGEDVVVFSMGEESSRDQVGRLDLHTAASLPPMQGNHRQANRVMNEGTLDGIPQLQPTFSPDGSFLAFVGIERGNNDIYTLPIHPQGMRQRGALHKVVEWPTPETLPSWSPDGRQLAFLSGREEHKEEWGLWVNSEAASGEPRRLQGRVMAEDAPAWYDEHHVFVVKIDEEAGNPIVFADTRTGAVRVLDVPTLRHVYVEFSNDGKRIAFCAKGRQTDPNLTWLKLYVADLAFTP